MKAAFLSALLAAAAWCDTTAVTYRGVAADQKTGRDLYTERHTQEMVGGRLGVLRTEFLHLDGKKFAERTLDFSASPSKPDYRLEDFRTGWVEGAEAGKEGIRVYCQKGKGKVLKDKRLKVPDPAVIDGGFNEYLKAHMADLDAGKKLSFNFVVPSYLNYFRFVAYMDKAAGKGGVKVLTAEPQNAVLRLVAPKIQVSYDPATGKMTAYKGISNVAKDGGGNQYISLVYPEGGP